MMRYTMYDQFTELVRSRGIEGAALYAREHGFSAVEFLGTVNPPFASVEEAAEARRVLADHGLDVACYSVGTTLYATPGEVDKLKRHAELAAAVGSPFLHHTLASALSPLPEAPSFETVCEDVLPRALEIARYAEGLGVTCLYEEQGFYFNGIRNFGTFYGRMRAETNNVGVCGDFGNILFADESPEDFLRAFASEIRHVHIKNYRVTNERVSNRSMRSAGGRFLTEAVLGEGAVDAAACLAILKDAGYAGHTALEIGFPFPGEYEDVVARDMAYLDALDMF